MANQLGIETFSYENASIEVQDNNEGGVSVIFHGKINMQNPSSIFNPFFDELHKKIVEAGIKEAIADFTDLQFLNSSGLKTIIRWVMLLTTLDDDSQYTLKVLYSNDIGWQETSLTTFKDLVPDLVDDQAV